MSDYRLQGISLQVESEVQVLLFRICCIAT